MNEKRLSQGDAVYAAMKALGGVATFGQLNVAALKVPGVAWKTKTPFASIRRIVQEDGRFFRIRPGLWALTAEREAVLARLNLSVSEPERPQEEFDHGYYQGLLVEIGNWREYGTFVPAQDKNRRFLDRRLADVATLDALPPFAYDEVLRKARTVDVTWFNRRGFPASLFEVEHSTDFYNSLLKFVELQDFHAEFRVVADAARKAEFTDRINGDAFTPIRGRVEFVSYDRVAAWHAHSAELAALPGGLSGL